EHRDQALDRRESALDRRERVLGLALDGGKVVQDLERGVLHALQRRWSRGYVVPWGLEWQLRRRMPHGIEEVGLEEPDPPDSRRRELDAQVRIDECAPRFRALETEPLERVDEDVGSDLHMAAVGSHGDVADRADGDSAPLDGRAHLETLYRLVEVAD